MDIPSWARPGVKVVCVDDAPKPGRLAINPKPPVGTICEIIEVKRSVLVGDDYYVLCIKDWPNQSVQGSGELGWDVRRFRPLQYPKQSEETDLAKFREFLTPETLEAFQDQRALEAAEHDD